MRSNVAAPPLNKLVVTVEVADREDIALYGAMLSRTVAEVNRIADGRCRPVLSGVATTTVGDDDCRQGARCSPWPEPD